MKNKRELFNNVFSNKARTTFHDNTIRVSANLFHKIQDYNKKTKEICKWHLSITNSIERKIWKTKESYLKT